MKVESKEVDYCRLHVNYEADSDVVKSKIGEAVSSLRHLRVPGFRPGKAPDYAIKAKLKAQINHYVMQEMASHAIDDIVFETNAKTIGVPKFSNVEFKDDNFKCEIDINTKPPITLGEYKGIEVKPAEALPLDIMLERALFDLRTRLGEVEPYNETDVAELGDQVTLSFSATIDGADPIQKEGELYQLGTYKWKNWDDNLLGMKAGEEKSFDFTFGENDQLEGKNAKFTVSLLMGTKRKPAELNEEFFKKLEVENELDLRTKLEAITKQSIERQKNSDIRNKVALGLVEMHDFKIPDFLIEAEAHHIASSVNVQFAALPPAEQEQFKNSASRNVKLSLLLDQIRDVEPDSVLNELEAQQSLINQLQMRGADVNQIMQDPKNRPLVAGLLGTIKDEFTLQWIASQAKITE